MREIDKNTLAALSGSRSGDELVCWVWYNGALAYPEPLPLSDWSLTWNGGDKQKIQGSLSLTVKDPDGSLAPWLFDDPLGVGGSQLQVFYRVGGAGDVRVGWYRIDSNNSEESWHFRIVREDGYLEADSNLPAGHRYEAVPTGASVSVTAKDLTLDVDADNFIAPEQPAGSSPTVRSEVERLIGDTLPIVYTDFVDAPVPKDVVWEDNRLEAVLDLLDVAGASHRMTGDGELELYRKSTVPVLTIAGGDEGIALNIFRAQNLTDFYNVGVIQSSVKRFQTIDGRSQEVEIPIYGYYEITSGPLRASGPFGRRVVRSQNPLMTTQDMANLAAKTLVVNRLSAQRVELDVRCLPNPALQVGDQVIIEAPQADGRLVPFTGEVVAASIGGSGTSVNPMGLTVSCLASDVMSALRGFSIADKLTNPAAPVTWETINPLRTWEQMNQSWDA